MNKLRSTIAFAALIAVAGMSDAHAGGFLADTFIKPFNPDLARAADHLNAQLGNPVDHAAAATLDGFVPGAGQALEGAWAIQRSGVLDGFNGGGGPAPQQNWQSQRNWQPQMQVGNFCMTGIGRAGPGPLQPVGAFCQDVFGNPGYIVR
ncbi:MULTISPECIES: hypothetical protein [unclassified Mesorhizobium]|uniref:hypothetical protein n=1 Tax=unclassified Mesorhizobium TaxID=325217 RepID=UPI0007FF6776|nr:MULTISPECIES: hypothetical protein [unclassified Mesorhizobium]MDG4886863.1 hypothetical protein [Mesorhizobium sp. WSM4887]OBQ92494.1 hypothetical protein A9K66_10600 [Mesorhizobium sp. AA23]